MKCFHIEFMDNLIPYFLKSERVSIFATPFVQILIQYLSNFYRAFMYK